MNLNTTALLRPTTVTRMAVGAAGLALAVSLAGCGSSETQATDTTDAEGSSATEGASGFPGGGGAMPGAFGTIAARDGDVLQVQSEVTGQVAVTVTDDTEITDQVAADLSDVEVGACVVIRSSDDSEAGPVTAESVAISAAGDDGCAAGAGGQDGAAEMPTDMPSDMPTDMPSDLPTDRAGLGVVGEVTAVDGQGFTVLATTPGSEGEEETAVEVTKSTSYTAEQDGDASALNVGRCVSATGETDNTGAVTAQRISVSDPVDGECATGGLGGRVGAAGTGS